MENNTIWLNSMPIDAECGCTCCDCEKDSPVKGITDTFLKLNGYKPQWTTVTDQDGKLLYVSLDSKKDSQDET